MGYPNTILILRHAEKPSNPSNEHLSLAGYQRAAALSPYFQGNFPGTDHIFAAGVGVHSPSQRSIETIKPLANALGLNVHDEFLKDDYQAMVAHIKSDSKYDGEQLIICWTHTYIEDLARAFGATGVPSAPWPADRFDLVWQLSYQGARGYLLKQIPQLLMYGDQNSVIGW